MEGLLQIVTGQTLADKLSRPSREVLDYVPMSALPALPGRPPDLAPRQEKPPAFRELLAREDAVSHGRILHHFANHELQAIELSAVALLRYPTAPREYRLELLSVLLDEQRHLRLYLQRMAELGVVFGELPLSFHFWKSLHDLPDFRTFICAMNLTFEQANLDFALEYRCLFHRRRDFATARILSRVLHDEIRHVSHGLCHFAASSENLWASYRKHLPEHLSPIRARGTVFSRAVRRRAGFDEEYIDTLFLFSDSRGRRPTVYHFNPPARGRLRNILTEDYGLLMSLLAAADDVVLHGPVRREFLLESRERGLHNCRFATVGELDRIPGRYVPFEHNQQSLLMIEQLKKFAGFQSHTPVFDSRRSHVLQLAAKAGWQSEGPFQRVFLNDGCNPEIERLQKSWNGTFVLKKERGASGHGFTFLKAGEAWGDLSPYCVVETWVDRLADVSFLFEVEKSGRIRPQGFTRFFTCDGIYRGTAIGAALPGREFSRLMIQMEILARNLGPALADSGYYGYAGMDGFLFDYRGQIYIQPCSEVNLRLTFGHLARQLQGRRSRSALFWTLPASAGRDLYTARPSGITFLTDPVVARRSVAILLEGGTLAQLLERALELEYRTSGLEKSWRQTESTSKLRVWMPSGKSSID